MKIPETTAQALQEAMHRFDEVLRNTTDWQGWEQDESVRQRNAPSASEARVMK